MEEYFIDIIGYEGLYKISNFGRVLAVKKECVRSGRLCVLKEKFLKQGVGKPGYFLVGLIKEGIQTTINVHKLMAICFLKKDTEFKKLSVAHIDGNKLNNKIDNLRVATYRENSTFYFKTKKNKTSKYIGVYYDKISKRYRSSITVNKKTKYIGSFINEEDAALSYLMELKKLN